MDGMYAPTYTIETPDNVQVAYTDRKRWWWLLSLANPLVPLVGIGGQLISGNELWLVVPLLLMFVMGPLL
ncbi:MAG: hypothetical protein ACE1ZA_17140, partial [Pseudomonadales bacterium]